MSDEQPRFNLKNVKPATFNDHVKEIMVQHNLSQQVAENLLGDLIMRKQTRESQNVIAKRWGVSFGQVSSAAHMGKITIDDARTMMGTKSITIANAALDALMDDINDPGKLSEMRTKDKLSIAKQMTDNALNLENKVVGNVTNNTVNVGDVSILIQQKAEREKAGGGDAMARLIAKGIKTIEVKE